MPKTSPAKAWIHGVTGRMGQKIAEAIANERTRFELLGGSGLGTGDLSKIAAADIIFDFSSVAGNAVLFSAMRIHARAGVAIVIGSTGLDDACLAEWRDFAGNRDIRLLAAPNTSLGILLLNQAVSLIAPVARANGFDIELVETHHRRKLDAPSGTAKFLADSICSAVPGLKTSLHHSPGPRPADQLTVHSVRGGGIFGEHEIRLISDHEEITLSHRALSRDLFADGALVMGGWLLKQKPGIYEIRDVEL